MFLRPICHISNKKALINDLYLDTANLIFGYIYDNPMSGTVLIFFFFFFEVKPTIFHSTPSHS